MLLSPDLSHVLLTRSAKYAQWYFPKGKINQGESDFDCAIREVGRLNHFFFFKEKSLCFVLPVKKVDEETSFNMRPFVRADEFIVHEEERTQLFVAIGVPESTPFGARSRGEVEVREGLSL